MAGDLDVVEAVAMNGDAATELKAAAENGGYPARVIHRYGHLSILALPNGERPTGGGRTTELGKPSNGLGGVERLGLAALELRESEEFRAAKRNRPRNGEEWDMPSCTTVVPTPEAGERLAEAAAPYQLVPRGHRRCRRRDRAGPHGGAAVHRRRVHQGDRGSPERPELVRDYESRRWHQLLL